MATESLHFPDYFPKNCPPDEATDDSIVIYRLCRTAIPTESDFISYYQLNPKKYKGMIQAYGLSVFSSMEDCIKAAKKSPALRDKYKFCSCGEDTPERGRTLATPSKTNPAHITWWVYEGVKPHTFFVGCTEGGGNNE